MGIACGWLGFTRAPRLEQPSEPASDGAQDPQRGTMSVAREERGNAFNTSYLSSYQTFWRQHDLVIKHPDSEIRLPGRESWPSLLGPG